MAPCQCQDASHFLVIFLAVTEDRTIGHSFCRAFHGLWSSAGIEEHSMPSEPKALFEILSSMKSKSLVGFYHPTLSWFGHHKSAMRLTLHCTHILLIPLDWQEKHNNMKDFLAAHYRPAKPSIYPLRNQRGRKTFTSFRTFRVVAQPGWKANFIMALSVVRNVRQVHRAYDQKRTVTIY